jgi:hemerythrin superfamily protein
MRFAQGGPDAIALLTRDHDVVRTALRDLLAAGEPRARAAALRHACAALRAHERREEAVFYPAVRRLRSRAGRRAVHSGLAAHQAIDGLVAELEQMDPDAPLFAERAARLHAAVTAHLREEEDGLFAEARTALAEDRLFRLARRMELMSVEPTLLDHHP